MTASLPRSMRLAISTSPSRVSSGTVPISRRYMRTGSLVLSSAPGVRSSSSSSAPSPVRSSSLSLAVLLVRVDDLDAGAAERVEQVVELVGRGDLRRQQLVDLVVEQVALFLADGDELPYFVVFFFDRQRHVLLSSASCPAYRLTTDSPLPMQRLDPLQQFLASSRAGHSIRLSVLAAPCSCSRSISRWIAARSRSSRSRLSARTQSAASGRGARPGGRFPRPAPASPVLRRSRSVCGKDVRRPSLQGSRLLEDRPGRQPLQIVLVELCQGRHAGRPDPA